MIFIYTTLLLIPNPAALLGPIQTKQNAKKHEHSSIMYGLRYVLYVVHAHTHTSLVPSFSSTCLQQQRKPTKSPYVL